MQSGNGAAGEAELAVVIILDDDMTVRELREVLLDYDGDMDVKVGVKYLIDDLDTVTYGVDMDTQTPSVWLCGSYHSGRKEG